MNADEVGRKRETTVVGIPLADKERRWGLSTRYNLKSQYRFRFLKANVENILIRVAPRLS
jgi:hypothetical protein